MNTPVKAPPRNVGAVSFRTPGAARPTLGVSAAAAAPKEETTPKAPNGSPLGNEYERVDLPTRCVPYDFDTLSLRKITAVDHAKIVRAVRHRNMSVLLDALSACQTSDMRLMTTEDFRAACYWHRANSYLKSPLTVTWRSIYGNECRGSAKSVTYEVQVLEKTKADYAADRERGYVLPTMGDLEVLSQMTDEDQIFMFENAQFVDPAPLAARIAELKGTTDSPTVDARIEKFQELSRVRGMEIIEEVAAYAESYKCSIIEKAVVEDPTFEYEAAVAYLTQMVASGEASDEQAEELARLTALREAPEGVSISAKQEVHTLPFNVWSFFPYV